MTIPFTETATVPVSQQSRELQLPTQAKTVDVTNTSTSASVVVNNAGPALLDGTGTTLAPGQSATVALQASGGGTLILSAIATGPNASVLVAMTPVLIDVGGSVLVEPGTPLQQAPE